MIADVKNIQKLMLFMSCSNEESALCSDTWENINKIVMFDLFYVSRIPYYCYFSFSIENCIEKSTKDLRPAVSG